MALLRDYINVGIEEHALGEGIEDDCEHESNHLVTIHSMDRLVAQAQTI